MTDHRRAFYSHGNFMLTGAIPPFPDATYSLSGEDAGEGGAV